jgi:hypothetical protein
MSVGRNEVEVEEPEINEAEYYEPEPDVEPELDGIPELIGEVGSCQGNGSINSRKWLRVFLRNRLNLGTKLGGQRSRRKMTTGWTGRET